MLSNTDSVVLNIDQINEFSGSNMLVTTSDRIQDIRSLINENKLQGLRDSIKYAFMNTETRECFHVDYENALINYGKYNIPTHIKNKKRQLNIPFNNRWIKIIKGCHLYIESLCPQVSASSSASNANNNVEELDVSGVDESTSIKRRFSTRERNSVTIFSPVHLKMKKIVPLIN